MCLPKQRIWSGPCPHRARSFSVIDRPLKRGQIWWVDFNPSRGSEQAGRRPALVVQSDIAHDSGYPLTIVVAMSTGSHGDEALHVNVDPSPLNGLNQSGTIKCEQLMTLSRDRLLSYSGVLEPRYMRKVEAALRQVLDLD
ncbi:type II toxin-antitoxin system PemK/MazF family toxin [bacterium]|nr:MAG: type II toxin-antitoxin system PemK/MazF family toxin [bacterium]